MRNDNSNKEKDKETNIQVVVRCRGRSEREIKDNSPAIVHTNSPHHLTVKPNFHDQNTARTYTFDSVYGPDASQQTVFLDVVKPMLEEILKGYNSTILCYGQTGTGKTFTMEGDLEAAEFAPNSFAGIIPRTLHHLFKVLETNSAEYSVRISYLELYNEELKDLLAIEDARLRMFEDATRKGVVVHGLEELLINSVVDGITALKKGSYKRRTAATKCNENSSRSHSIFSITVHMKEATPDGEDLLSIGKLNLVDLAGSENISRSGAENRRAREAGLINQSLLTLGRVINSLVERSAHVPYRESKLTRLLQDSLGGKTKTSIIATISPAKYNLDETLSTLDYANRAKNIRNKPEINQRMTKKALIREYVAEIERLKSDLSATRDKNGVFLSAESYQHLQDESQSRKDQINEMKRVLETTEKQIQFTEEKFRANMELVDSLRSDLITTRQLLSHQEFITGAYARTEGKLNFLAAGLVATLQESVRDVSGLHAKIDRKRKLETENMNACDEFQRVLLAKTTEIESQISSFRTVQHKFSQDLMKQAEEFVGKLNTSIDEISRRSVDETIQQLAVDFEAIEDSTALRGQANMELRKRMEELRNDFVHMIAGKHNEASRSHLSDFASIKGSIESYSNQVQLWHADVVSKYDNLEALVHGYGEDQASALCEMREIVQRESDAERSQLLEHNRKLTAMLHEERQESSRDRDELIQQIGNLVTSFSERRNQAVTSRVEDIQSAIMDTRETMHSFVYSYVRESQSAEKGLQDYRTSFSKAFSDIENDRSIANERSLEHATTLTSGMDDLQRSVISNLEEIHFSVQETNAALNDLANAGGETDAEAERADVNAIRRAKEKISERCSGLKTALEGFRGDVDKHGNTVHTAVVTNVRDSELFDEDLSERISYAREEIGGLVAKRIKYDNPTGKTPRRRVYKFPRSWRLTQPKETMLAAVSKGGKDEGNALMDGGEVIEYVNIGGGEEEEEEEEEAEMETEMEMERDTYDSDETCSPTKSSRRNFDKENVVRGAVTTTPPEEITQKSSLPSGSLPATPTTRLPRRRVLISKNCEFDGDDGDEATNPQSGVI